MQGRVDAGVRPAVPGEDSMKMHRQTATWLAMMALVAPAALAQPEPGRCAFRDTRELSGPAAGTLDVKSGAGPVEIVGEPELGEIRVSAILCASDQERLDALSVSLTGGRLETGYPKGGWSLFGSGGYAAISLLVRVPSDTGIELEDGSGSVSVSGVGRLVVDDGSGRLQISGVQGDVRVEDGSGSLRIEDVTGNVAVNDGSGGLRITGVDGDVAIDDGSGSLNVRGVTGNVLVSDDGSGGIEIEQVGGGVRIADAGSGGVQVRDIEGDLTVRGVRRSRIDYDNIRGALDLPSERRRR